MQSTFDLKLKQYSDTVQEYILSHKLQFTRNVDMRESALHYSTLGGKKLRPFAVLATCGAVGGNPMRALPLAAAVEIFHTWTLVHDDIIDRDTKRRWGDSVHARWAKVARANYGWEKDAAEHYGLTVGILTGDLQKGWSVAGLLPQLYYENNVKPEIVLRLIHELDYVTLQYLVDGELDDVLYSKMPVLEISAEKIIGMLWNKTGSLYRFCGLGGAMIGLDTDDSDDPRVVAMAEFAAQCGLAFQIQDDILGITGKEDQLGKPAGSDLREGKRTLLILWAYSHASLDERRKLDTVLGNSNASKAEAEEVVDIIRRLDAIKFASERARTYIDGGTIDGKEIVGARKLLDRLESSEYTSLLTNWADYLVRRTF